MTARGLDYTDEVFIYNERDVMKTKKAAPAKKSAAKKTVAKKTVAKKTVAKKTVAAKKPAPKKLTLTSTGKKKMEKVLGEFKEGTLHSGRRGTGSKRGPVVKTRVQAVAIAMSEARKAQKGAQAKKAPAKKAR